MLEKKNWIQTSFTQFKIDHMSYPTGGAGIKWIYTTTFTTTIANNNNANEPPGRPVQKFS